MIDINKIIILILQSIQLPIVAFIIFFTLNASITDGIKQDSFKLIGNIRGRINKKKPLFLIAIGFLFNFVYLILNMLIYWETIISEIKITQSDLDFYDSIISLIFFLNTYCFLLQFISQIYISKNKNDGTINPTIVRANIFFWKVFNSIFITLFTVIIWVIFHNTPYVLSLFNFFSFMFVSIYLLKLTSNNLLQDSYSRYLFLGGWNIWTSLQLWTTINIVLNLSPDLHQLLNHSVSIIAKCLILFGFYKFTVNIGRLANTRIESLNTILNFTNLQLTEKNLQLEQTVERINSLQKLIISISDSDSLEKLSSRVVNHLTDKELFDFDYAIFSEVNYLQQKIIYKNSKSVNINIEQAEKWVQNEGFSFDHRDMLAHVFRERKTINVYQNHFDGKVIDLSSKTSPIDVEVYYKFNHQNLNRFFIPVLNLKKSENDSNQVIAVIEVGYYVNNIESSSNAHRQSDNIINQAELNLYIDNCAQTYKRIFNQVVENEIDSLLENCNFSSKDDYILYLQKILNAICQLVNAKFGFFALFPMSKISPTPDFIFSEDQSQNYKLEQIEKILFECLEVNIESNEYLEINENKFSNKIHKLLNTDSLQINRINDYENKFGYLIVLGENENFSNEVVKSILTKITEKIYSTYKEKKFHNMIASLVKPDNVITDLEMTFQPLIEILKIYFGTPYISFWLMQSMDNQDYYVQKFASRELILNCKNFSSNQIRADEICLDNEYKSINLDSNNADIKDPSFKELTNLTKIKTILRKPLKIDHQKFGFIKIYFIKNKKQVVYEDENFMNLISVKAVTTIQIHNLVGAFRDISDSFKQNDLKNTLQTITTSALNLLDADPVILFISNNGTDVFFNDVAISNKENFRDSQLIELFKNESVSHVKFAENIIKEGSSFFSNKIEYKDYVRKHSIDYEKIHFEKEFWERESIQSLAAIRLIHKTKNYIKPVGVMFINFRKKIIFNEEIKTLINTFADLASGAIYNGLAFEQNRKFLLDSLRLTKPLVTEAVTAGALHDTKKIFSTIHYLFKSLIEKINNPYEYHKKITVTESKVALEKLIPFFSRLEDGFYRIESLYAPTQKRNFQYHNIIKIMDQQLEFMQAQLRQKNIKVKVDFPDERIWVSCDESQIGLAIFNILNNAYQAMDSRGVLKITLRRMVNSQIKIEIIDNGKGISDDIKPIMFRPYISNKQGGSGLGLSMSKYVIEQIHLGHLTGNSRDGYTTFKIILPVDLPSNVETETNN